ncbi:BPSS1780 family membrane protein [Rhodocyclus gracilis]|uniref:DUF2189 domain-containing protein n=1 Tax=Rhodocyclus tenuis TaxID=1066 RepID=A0A6L5K0D4_RHOTE|nr:BPSS1780 family membrane protein [Rhodocyclus gracilis]MQY52572.1 hypothetical protein [Rhodocyclus gracilis]
MSTQPDAFPLAAPPFAGASRRAPIDAAFAWLRLGWLLFTGNPGVWIGIAVLFIVAMLGLSIVPLVGQLAANLLLPVFIAGLLTACRRTADGEMPAIADLFAGFRQNTGPLILLGVLFMLGMFLIGAIVFVLAGGSLASALAVGRPAGFGLAFGGLMVAALLWLVLSAPLLMAICFAPALVSFHAMAPLPALKASFSACLKNAPVFLVFGLLTLVLAFFAALPAGLGFLVLGPVLAGATYAAYRDIFIGA